MQENKQINASQLPQPCKKWVKRWVKRSNPKYNTSISILPLEVRHFRFQFTPSIIPHCLFYFSLSVYMWVCVNICLSLNIHGFLSRKQLFYFFTCSLSFSSHSQNCSHESMLWIMYYEDLFPKLVFQNVFFLKKSYTIQVEIEWN